MSENKTQMYEHFGRQGKRLLEGTPPGREPYTKRRKMSNRYTAFHLKQQENQGANETGSRKEAVIAFRA